MRVSSFLITMLFIGVASSYADERSMIVDHVKKNKERCDIARMNVHKNPLYYSGIVQTCNENTRGDSSIQSVFNKNVPEGLLESLKNSSSVLNSRKNVHIYSEADSLDDDPFFDD